MAKSKMTIADIQKALLSNTKFIKEAETEEAQEPVRREVAKPNAQGFSIDPLILKKYRILASYMNVPTDELLNTALNHFIKLKAIQLEQAMLKLTEEK